MITSISPFLDQAAPIPFFRRCQKAPFIARERSAFVDPEAVEAATSHIRRSSVIPHTRGCEPVDPSRCQVDYFPKHVSAEAVLQGRYSATILWQSPDLNSTSESLTPIPLQYCFFHIEYKYTP